MPLGLAVGTMAEADADDDPPTTVACQCCGAPCSPSRSHRGFSSVPSPLSYRPLRAPALNVSDRASARAAIIHSPVPSPLPVPLLSAPFSFLRPTRRLPELPHSPASFPLFLGFIASLSHSALRKKISDPLPSPISPPLSSLLSLLRTLSSWIDPSTPLPLWHHRLATDARPLASDLLPPDLKPAIVEIFPYLLGSFGDPDLVLYGAGHEANFAAFLFFLARLGLLKEEDYQGVVLRVFVEYVHLMRKLRTEYRLEPATLDGAWGLDDYHFLPFIFGSAQLVDHKYMKPKSIHNEDILENFSQEYMYFECVAFVRKVKKGVFAEHSPLLDDISAAKSWSKVNSGLLKMYRAEVLEKAPVMQHFLFGSIIQWE